MSVEIKSQITMKPISIIKPKTNECVICCQPYDSDTAIVECSVCHQNSHSDCQLFWAITNTFSDPEGEPTCPFCRSVWKNNDSQLFPAM
jgi:hypothetical protein